MLHVLCEVYYIIRYIIYIYIYIYIYDTSVDPKQPVYFEIKKPPWVSVVRVVIACCICSKHDPCICSKQCNVALSASIAPVAAKSCKRSDLSPCPPPQRSQRPAPKVLPQTSGPILSPSVHSALSQIICNTHKL